MTSEQKQPKARVLAYYLPQFHPIPENDAWWGKGFTEWTNVGKAKPLFPGHYQPHVPADLGYYDLRVPETREAQAQMAREAGIEGFVYWHYWFGNGKRLLERPFNEVLASGKPDFPFALAWANQTWQGFNFGVNNERNVLIEQIYPGDEDYIAHFNAVLPAFLDKRYITCEEKPIFIIYMPDEIPNVTHFLSLWRELAIKNGLKGIYFISHDMNRLTEKAAQSTYNKRIAQGFDGVNYVNLMRYNLQELPFWFRVARKLFHKNQKLRLIPEIKPYDTEVFKTALDDIENVFPTIVPDWDHTPRSGVNGIALVGSTPEKFGSIAKEMVTRISRKPEEKRFLFIKSWNEWAEGNYMEPDLRWGTRYLDNLQNAVLEK